MITQILLSVLLGAGSPPTLRLSAVRSPASPIVLAQHQVQAAAAEEESPADRMRHRFPQPVRVGDLIGLRVLDYNDVTIGIVRQVVRTPEARILLIVAHTGVLGWGGRLVAVPIEAVAILGRQLASLDMMPEEYAAAPTWTGGGEVIAPDEKILIGLTRR
jgi:hypothetical protein